MAGGKTQKQKESEKKKADTKKKPTEKDMSAKKSTKSKKKKWSKGKTKEKVNNVAFWTKQLWDKLNRDIISKEAYITPSVISEKLKVNVSIARQAIRQLLEEEKLAHYNDESHSRWGLFIRSANFQKQVDEKAAADAKDKKDKPSKKQKKQ